MKHRVYVLASYILTNSPQNQSLNQSVNQKHIYIASKCHKQMKGKNSVLNKTK